MSSLPILALKYPNKMFTFRGFIEYVFQFLKDAVLHFINFILFWGHERLEQ
jgi:hypothetical protein